MLGCARHRPGIGSAAIRHASTQTTLSGTRPAKQHRAQPLGDSTGQQSNRVFERHRIGGARQAARSWTCTIRAIESVSVLLTIGLTCRLGPQCMKDDPPQPVASIGSGGQTQPAGGRDRALLRPRPDMHHVPRYPRGRPLPVATDRRGQQRRPTPTPRRIRRSAGARVLAGVIDEYRRVA